MSLNIFNKEKKDCDPVPVGGSSKEFKLHIGNMIASAFGSHGLRYDESNKKLFIKKNDGQEEEFVGGSQSMISDAWTPKSYTQGQLCIDDNKLWKAKATTDNNKPVEGQMWESTTIEKEFSKLNSDFGKVSILNPTINNTYFEVISSNCRRNNNIVSLDLFLKCISIPPADTKVIYDIPFLYVSNLYMYETDGYGCANGEIINCMPSSDGKGLSFNYGGVAKVKVGSHYILSERYITG